MNQYRKKIQQKHSKKRFLKLPTVADWDIVYALLGADENGLSEKQIAVRAKLPVATVRNIIQALAEAKLVEFIPETELYRSKSLHAFFEEDSLHEKSFLLEKLNRFKKSLQENFGKRDQVFFRNMILSVPQNRFLEFRERLKELLDEFVDEVETPLGEELAEIFVAFEKRV